MKCTRTLEVSSVKRKAVHNEIADLWAGTDVTCRSNNLINDQKSWEKRVTIMVSSWISDYLHSRKVFLVT